MLEKSNITKPHNHVSMYLEQFSLKWGEFCNNAAFSFQALFKDTNFTNVTLASSEGHTVGAELLQPGVEVNVGQEQPPQKENVSGTIQQGTARSICRLGPKLIKKALPGL